MTPIEIGIEIENDGNGQHIDPEKTVGGWKLIRICHAPEVPIGRAFKGAAVVALLQTFDNAANGHLRERPQGDIFSAMCVLIGRAPDGVSNAQMRIFVQGQGNQAVARRRSVLRRTNNSVD